MRPYLSKRKIKQIQEHGKLLIEVSHEFAAFWEGPYTTPKGDVCVICGGAYPFPDKYGWGLKPDRDRRPDLFICWECVHWLTPKLVEHLRSNSYNFEFSEYPPFKHTLGTPAGTSINNGGDRT